MTSEVFQIPNYFDYGATFLWAVSGALVAARRGYDISGMLALALVSSTGGGLLRDGVFLQNGPPVLVRTPVYLLIILAAALLVRLGGSQLRKLPNILRVHLVQIVDALGLGAYAVVGMQLSLAAGLSLPGTALVGVLNAVGGGVLRDVLTGQPVELFKPWTLLAIAALAGCLTFLLLVEGLKVPAILAAWPTIIVTFLIRTISVRYDIRTRPLRDLMPEDAK